MKHTSVRSNAQQRTATRSQHRPVTGSMGMSIAPPVYGIDFVDRQPSTAREMTVQRYGGETTLTREKQRENRTGLPDHLKAGIESLSGVDLSDVNVHFNSSKPAALQALAYTQGTDIHVAPGQERHLPHEAWHVVQQTQGRVQPRFQLKGEQINDDQGLEHEADVMGARAAQLRQPDGSETWTMAETEMSVQQSGEMGKAFRTQVEPLGKVTQRQSAIQLSRGFFGGIATGAALGGVFAGPAGAIGGAIGGAVLGPVFEWWNNLPIPIRPTPAELTMARQGLRQTSGPVPYTAPISPAALKVGKQNLRQTSGPVPYTVPIDPAVVLLNAGRQNLTPTPAPVPYTAPINPTVLNAAKQQLTNIPAHVGGSLVWPEVGWHLATPDPQVVSISEQIRGKRLNEMIKLPEGVKLGQVLYHGNQGQALTADTILRSGVFVIRYRYMRLDGVMSAPKQTTLHIKPTNDDLMVEMGFVSRDWRWELPCGVHGTLNRNFHLSVPKALQCPLERMDDIADIIQRLFPLGKGLDGTHMSIECRTGNDPSMNNAAYFLNGTPKFPKGYTKQEQELYVNACKARMNIWKDQSLQLCRNALTRL